MTVNNTSRRTGLRSRISGSDVWRDRVFAIGSASPGAFGGVRGRSELPSYVQRYMQGEFKLDDFITHTMPLEQINEAFDLMHEGKSIRTVIHY